AGATLNLQVGDLIRLVLPENPTTGFRWANDEFDKALLLMVSSTFHSGSTSLPGAAGTVTFLFKAQRAGSTVLSFKLWRSWSGNSSIAQRYQVNVLIHVA